jgi:glycosyltransferase involved in cell wall biosynthesis
MDPETGGPAECIRQLTGHASASGYQAEILTLDPPDAEFLTQIDVPIHALGPSKKRYAYNRHIVRWLRAHAKEYAAVIVNGLWQYPSFAVWLALRNSRTPYYVFAHGMLDPWFKYAYPLKHIKKWLYWPWAEYRVLRDAGSVLFTCEEEKSRARESFWLYECKELVVGLGTSAPPKDKLQFVESFFKEHPALRNRRILLFMGRITEKKGCDLLIRSFSETTHAHPDLHLVMAGPEDPGIGADLRALAKKLGVEDKITWTGMVSGNLKWGAFYASEVFVLPSHQENFGLVVAESLGCGCPVLISNKVNIWHEIQADNAGLVEEDSVEGTTKNLQHWLNMPSSKKDAMRASALDCFTKRFSIGVTSEKIREVVKQSVPD